MHYLYKCSKCGKEFDAEFIESNNYYLCPDCGALEKNAPLEGVLEVEYNYSNIIKEYGIIDLKEKISGSFESIPELLPLSFDKTLTPVFKGITSKQLNIIKLSSFFADINYKGYNVDLLDDSRNPSFSFKDRASILVALKAIQMGKESVICASTGNAGSSIAGICSRLGLKSIIFVPEKIPVPKKLQIEMYGAELIKVNGDYDLAFDLSLEISNKLGLYNRNTAYNPLTIEGKKTAAFEIFAKFKDNLPKYIVVPSGDGVIIGGVYKGFENLLNLGLIDKIPILIAAQPSNGSAIIDYFEKGYFEYKSSLTIADSLSAGAPRNLYLADKALKKSGGFGVRIEDDITLKFQKELSSKFGFLVEPAAAISFAALDHLINQKQLQKDDSVLLMLTGNGLKDTNSFLRYAEKDKTYSKEDIYNHFGITN